jgi:hypothetical protein
MSINFNNLPSETKYIIFGINRRDAQRRSILSTHLSQIRNYRPKYWGCEINNRCQWEAYGLSANRNLRQGNGYYDEEQNFDHFINTKGRLSGFVLDNGHYYKTEPSHNYINTHEEGVKIRKVYTNLEDLEINEWITYGTVREYYL